MRLSNRKILNDINTLVAISQKQLPIKVSYAIAKNINKLENELKTYNQERQKLIDKYCLKDENGNNVVDEYNNLKIADENIETWNKEMNELLDIEIDIDMHKFNLDCLINSNIEMKPAEIMTIHYMIEGEI